MYGRLLSVNLSLAIRSLPYFIKLSTACASHRGSASSYQQKKDKPLLVPFLSMAGLSWIIASHFAVAHFILFHKIVVRFATCYFELGTSCRHSTQNPLNPFVLRTGKLKPSPFQYKKRNNFCYSSFYCRWCYYFGTF